MTLMRNNTMMRTAGFLVPLFLLLCLSNRPAVSMQADDALEQGYKLSQSLGGPERLFYWTELCRVSVLVDLPVQKTRETCFLPFDLAASTEDPRTRIAAQKNALAELSYVAPRLAIELFPQIEVQRPSTGHMLPEDLRSDALKPIFLNLLAVAPLDGPSIIRAQAKHAGTAGQYPYRAMAAVLGVLPKSRKREANGIVSDALSFYERDTGYYNRDEEFLVLLQSLKNSAVDHSVASQAVAVFAKRITHDPIRIRGHYYSEIRTAKNKTFSFTDRNRAFFFQAFPDIRRFNPSLADQLRKQDPRLDQATDNMGYISGGFVQNAPGAEQVKQQHLRWVERSLVDRIRELQNCDPASAVFLADQLKDPGARIVGVSASISAIARNSLSDAQNILDQQLSAVEKLDPSTDKLQALVALVAPTYRLGDPKQYESLVTQAFDLGIRLFSAHTSADRVQNQNGFAELQDLVTFTASRPVDLLKEKVRQLPDGWLKAYLWLYEEEGRVQPRVRQTAPLPCRD
ncbi:MAG TPA: hypothetical protein VI685_23060 [Candidatus Angelobacter sp.]